MINSTFGGFMTARQGMAASQHGLNLTGHNLTNSATEGYTRQRVDQVSLNFNGTYRYASPYNVNIGNGVLVTGTSQLRDPFLDLRYRNEVAHVGEQGKKLEVLNDLQSILDEVKNAGDDTLGDGGIFNQLGDILAKLQQLSNEVGNKEFDNMVKSSCQSLVTLFQSYDKRIQEVSDNLSYDLENVDVPRVNDILKSIRELNKTIKTNEIMGNSALELKDQRNLLIDELSGYMKINVLYKPVQVSASTVVDELTISMVGSDGNYYALVADEQCRELVLSDDGNQDGPGNYNIGLSALSPVDTELRSELQNTLIALTKAEETNNPKALRNAYIDAFNAFKQVRNTRSELFKKVYGTNDGTNDGTISKLQKAENEKDIALGTLQKAAQDAATNTNPDKTAELQEAFANAQKDYNTKYDAFVAARVEHTKELSALESYEEKTYNPAKEVYLAAVKQLPTDPAQAGIDMNSDYGKDLTKGQDVPLVGGNGAQSKLDELKEKKEKLLESLAISQENGKAVDSINTLLVDGSLKGTLEMLNYSGEYDNPPNSIRGIGYYQQALDTLAYEFATKFNEANNPANVVQKDVNGNPIYRLDKDGNPIPKVNKDGTPVYQLDKNGKPVQKTDENGNPVFELDTNGDKVPVYVPAYETSYNLFGSTDGQKIDAGNICIADGWVKNEYSITASMKVDASSGSNDNILHMISMFGEKFSFKASENLMSKITFNSKAGGDQDAMGDTINGMKPGDTITVDGKTFTYVKGATGANGTEFDINDRQSLLTAGEKQGLTISVDPDTNAITAQTAAQDLKNMVMVGDKQMTKLSDIKLENLRYGDTITIDGKTFTYRPDSPVQKDVNDKEQDLEGDAIFRDFDSLVAEAALKNIKIEGEQQFAEDGTTPLKDVNGNPVYTITTVERSPGRPISAADITVDKAPTISDLQYGDTIVINNGINPPVELTYTEPTAPDTTLTEDDIKDGKFSSAEELMQAAKEQALDLYVDQDTGEITSATAVGSNLFSGTFEEYFTNIGSTLGLDIQATTEMLDNYSQLASTIAQNREAVTGVSLDEEAMNIMRYQQSYNASARLMTALDEMLSTLISNTGVVGR